jgi:predicted ribosome quality control (RQC) complex YloA/Tae2 family protein
MQPFDALTMRAVLKEAGPLLINKKVDGVYQFGRDEILLGFRAKSGVTQFRVSAHPVYGRLCLVKSSTDHKTSGSEIRSSFFAILKKNLFGATLIGLEQMAGERILDMIFSCLDEVGQASIKTLTAEIMGRHSNLIFWERNDQKIIASSHLVSNEMSRLRQIQPGLKYTRPPGQERKSVFTLAEDEFKQGFGGQDFTRLEDPADRAALLEKWLVSNYSGLGKNLASEIVRSVVTIDSHDLLGERLFSCLKMIGNDDQFRPAIKLDFSRYTVFDLANEASDSDNWQTLPAVNDLVEQFYSANEARDTFKQTKERMFKEATAEIEKLKSRWQAISQDRTNGSGTENPKLFGDLILANLKAITSGQSELICQNIFSEGLEDVVIPLVSNLTATQNAQNYYRQFAKVRNRRRTAELTWQDTKTKIEKAEHKLAAIEKADGIDNLRAILKGSDGQALGKAREVKPSPKKDKNKTRFLTVTSSDGWLIYVGRNRQENDLLLSKVSQPYDLWLHILGTSGAHVLVKVPSSKNDPPHTTIKEAAQLAARFSKVTSGVKVRVVYTEARFVKRTKGTSGVVNYENEKTIEIDTNQPLPKIFKQLFAKRD